MTREEHIQQMKRDLMVSSGSSAPIVLTADEQQDVYEFTKAIAEMQGIVVL